MDTANSVDPRSAQIAKKCFFKIFYSVINFQQNTILAEILNEPVREKTNNLGSDQVLHKSWLEAGNFGFRKNVLSV